MKGKNLGLVDPNSTSGYNMPLFALNKLGINAEQFFGKVLITGSHEKRRAGAVAGDGGCWRPISGTRRTTAI